MQIDRQIDVFTGKAPSACVAGLPGGPAARPHSVTYKARTKRKKTMQRCHNKFVNKKLCMQVSECRHPHQNNCFRSNCPMHLGIYTQSMHILLINLYKGCLPILIFIGKVYSTEEALLSAPVLVGVDSFYMATVCLHITSCIQRAQKPYCARHPWGRTFVLTQLQEFAVLALVKWIYVFTEESSRRRWQGVVPSL